MAQLSPSSVIRHDKTNFPLIGKHRTVPCTECHLDGTRKGTPRDCEACHWYRKPDDRYGLRLGLHCGDCHTPLDWKSIIPGSWEHERETGFRLGGVHRTIDCYRCHANGVFPGQGVECIDCHGEDYNEAGEPNHAAGQFPTDCKICHNMTAWEGASYYHPGFPRGGLHKTADCTECHRGGLFAGTPTACASCHLEDYNNAFNPNHRQAGYPLECEVCHGAGASGWQGASVNHDRFWPLKGMHRRQECLDCHAGGYTITSACVNCHLDDYNNTREPDHRAAGFHTNCEVCHLDEARDWSQASFNHPFPIISGDHGHLSCTDCHRGADYLDFSCIDCHEHEKSRMDNEHGDVAGYIYNSQACYACHPTGEG
jgi:hypothetical protein